MKYINNLFSNSIYKYFKFTKKNISIIKNVQGDNNYNNVKSNT